MSSIYSLARYSIKTQNSLTILLAMQACIQNRHK